MGSSVRDFVGMIALLTQLFIKNMPEKSIPGFFRFGKPGACPDLPPRIKHANA
jgi:hypothetical protein